MPKVDIEGDLSKLDKRLDDLKKGIDKLENMFQKKRQEFETINMGLWEGKKVMEDTQKDIKREKDGKKMAALAKQLEEEEKTFKKMSQKLDGIIKELLSMGTTGGNLERSLKDEAKTLTSLEKDIKRTGGEIKQLKEWDSKMKDMDKFINRESLRAFTVADEVKNLPKPPKL